MPDFSASGYSEITRPLKKLDKLERHLIRAVLITSLDVSTHLRAELKARGAGPLLIVASRDLHIQLKDILIHENNPEKP